ncbi:unnamed protein product [Paramecium sonneborni]|uniref:Uncharacterized protein n=1 Tax=Paramecium sonneborni TaxID=65129 RepID=A0A8S1RPY1_9CILI|nr:unnamed protein product [Paramecium sonneborni]
MKGKGISTILKVQGLVYLCLMNIRKQLFGQIKPQKSILTINYHCIKSGLFKTAQIIQGSNYIGRQSLRDRSLILIAIILQRVAQISHGQITLYKHQTNMQKR